MFKHQKKLESKQEKKLLNKISAKYFKPNLFWFLTKSKERILFDPEELQKSDYDSHPFLGHSFDFLKYTQESTKEQSRQISCIGESRIPLICMNKHDEGLRKLSSEKQKTYRFVHEINSIEFIFYESSSEDSVSSSIHYDGDKLTFWVYLPLDEFEEYWELKVCNQLFFDIAVKLPMYEESNFSMFQRNYIDVLNTLKSDDTSGFTHTGTDETEIFNVKSYMKLPISDIDISYHVTHNEDRLKQELEHLWAMKDLKRL